MARSTADLMRELALGVAMQSLGSGGRREAEPDDRLREAAVAAVLEDMLGGQREAAAAHRERAAARDDRLFQVRVAQAQEAARRRERGEERQERAGDRAWERQRAEREDQWEREKADRAERLQRDQMAADRRLDPEAAQAHAAQLDRILEVYRGDKSAPASKRAMQRAYMLDMAEAQGPETAKALREQLDALMAEEAAADRLAEQQPRKASSWWDTMMGRKPLYGPGSE